MIVCQGNRFLGKSLTVEGQFICTSPIRRQTADRDVIKGLPVSIVNFLIRPARRKTWNHTQAIAFEMDAEQSFSEESVHPAG